MTDEKIISVMEQYHVFKEKVSKMNNNTLKKAITIIDTADGVSPKSSPMYTVVSANSISSSVVTSPLIKLSI